MNALKHMEFIFAGVLVIGCIVALTPPRPSAPRASVAAPAQLPMPVVVITGKRPAQPAKRAVQPAEPRVTTAER